MRRLSILLVFGMLVLGLVMLPAVITHAQDDPKPIEFGKTLAGNITHQTFEVPYTFEGARDDLIMATMMSVESPSYGGGPTPSAATRVSAALILLDSDYNILATDVNYMGVGPGALLIARLPYDGEYILLATRDNGRLGNGTGQFELTLTQPEVLEFDSRVTGTVSRGEKQYFLVDLHEPFQVVYKRESGDISPGVDVYRLDTSYASALGYLSGSGLTGGMLEIAPTSNVAANLHLIEVEGSCCADEDDIAEFSLEIRRPE